jgi:hypothetical protein
VFRSLETAHEREFSMRRFLGLLFVSVLAGVATLALLVFPGLLGTTGSRAVAAAPVQNIGMKVLLITDSNTTPGSVDCSSVAGIAYCDWVNTLKREGVPFDSKGSTDATLPPLSSTQPDGSQVANYEGVVVTGSGAAGLSTADWAALQTYEQKFSVRQVTAYAVPSADYGLSAPAATTLSNTSALSLTAGGHTVFPYLNAIALDAGTFGYEGTPLPGAKLNTLATGPNGSTVLGVYTSADGRETMFQTFNQNQFLLQSGLLRHGELAWLTRNTYFGDQRNYLETHIDDNFLSDDTWSTATHSTDYDAAHALREVPADVTTAVNWSAQNKFRIDMLYNGGGSTGTTDPLLPAFRAVKNSFGWINHTWDHPNLDEGCAPAAYIESEISQNNNWATNATTGLGLTSSTDPTQALGVNNPSVYVSGEHSGLANLVPGNPGTVDPPAFNDAPTATPVTAGGLGAGTYTYAITDQFSSTGGESSASSTQVVLAAPVAPNVGSSVTVTWDAVCHASDYKIYRQNPDMTWSLLTTVSQPTGAFTSTGPQTLSYTDTGGGTAASTPLTTNNATESPYEQNTELATAFGALKMTAFGSDASKPYPNPATTTFATGPYSGASYPAGATFTDSGATAVPRYPTNIFYNVATNAQEVDEYQTIYDLAPSGACKDIPGVTTCNPSGTAFTIAQIIASIDQGMFQHIMGNDPRPHYFHQTNLMSQPGQGDGLYYETVNPLLTQYRQYFADNAPIVQLTMPQIGTLLTEQAGWAASSGKVTGSIQGNTVTVANGTGGQLEIPLTGTTVGSPYAGSQSGWVLAPAGTSTYTALAAWPAPPVAPPTVQPPTGPAPTGKPITKPGGGPPPPPKQSHPGKPIVAKPQPRVVVQVAPKTVRVKHGAKVTVSLKCIAARGQTCTGSFTLTPMGQSVSQKFRIKASNISRIAVKLPKRARLAAAAAAKSGNPGKSGKAGKSGNAGKPGKAGKRHRTVHAKLTIRTSQAKGAAKFTRGMLGIRI